MFAETRSGNMLHEGYYRGLTRVLERTPKPVIIVNNVAAVGDDDLVVRLTRSQIPVLIGIDPALAVIRGAFDRRDRLRRPPMKPVAAPAGARAKWVTRLQAGGTLDEAESLALLADYGIPVLPNRIVVSASEARAAAEAIGWPVALKSAKPGLFHKSDVGGVRLRLADAAALEVAYADMSARLGSRMLVMRMAGKGVELSLGSVTDLQFGPLAMIGAGGILIEMLKDRRFVLPPIDTAEARRQIDRLATRPLLDGKRGQPPADIGAVAGAFASFTALVADLGDLVAEIDINPLLALPEGAVALDALVVPAAGK
jgi:acyl-CoA synthetase (NDP forming)